MRRVVVPLAAFVAAAIVAVGIGLVLQARGGEGGGTSSSSPRASLSVVSTTVRPAVHHFGEPVVAELVVVADKAQVDPATVRVNPDFSPYEPIGPRQVQRTETDASVRWRIRFALRCLRDGCAPDGARRTIEFPGTGVVYRFRSAQGPSTAIVDWPPFEVSARVPDDALSPEKWRADVTSLPAVTYGRSPGTLGAALLGASILFALVGVGIVWWLARAREPEPLEIVAGEEERMTQLDRALRLAREAALDGDSPERRKAFERVARELGVRGLADLADRARALAWGPGPADLVAVDELTRDARAATNGGPA